MHVYLIIYGTMVFKNKQNSFIKTCLCGLSQSGPDIVVLGYGYHKVFFLYLKEYNCLIAGRGYLLVNYKKKIRKTK